MTQSEPNSPVNTVRYRTAPSSPAVNGNNNNNNTTNAAAIAQHNSDLFSSLFTSPPRPTDNESMATKDLDFILPVQPKAKLVADEIANAHGPQPNIERLPSSDEELIQQQQVVEDQGVVDTRTPPPQALPILSIHDRLVSPASPFISASRLNSAQEAEEEKAATETEINLSPVNGTDDDHTHILTPSGSQHLPIPESIALPEQVDYSFAWSIATQKGYRYANALARSVKLEIHSHMEDMHYPYSRNSPNHVHPITGRPFQVFMLADGHGGHECATFAVNTLPSECVKIMNSKTWNFDLESDRTECERLIQKAFLAADSEYCSKKLEQFRQWIKKILDMGGNPTDTRYKAEKPTDDGCTLVVNILYEGYLINCNVGDSRTLALRRGGYLDGSSGELAADFPGSLWSPVFASVDHTPGHPERARMLHDNGGRFIYNGITVQEVHTVFEAEHISEMAAQLSNLSHCRIGRQLGWRIQEIDFPALTTLNLTGTMGDLFFKHDPPLITAQPDVSFHRLKPLNTNNSYMLVMATDGLWDHMSRQDPDGQHHMIADYVTLAMEADLVSDSRFLGDNNPTTAENKNNSISAEIQRKLEKLGVLAHGMADREMISGDNNLFTRGFLRYDDVTVFIVMIEGVPQQQH